VRVAFLGPPGAGKGTQARDLAREWGALHLATGDMLREALAAGTPLGLEAKRYMDQGALVPDDVIIRMVAERLGGAGAAGGFILDGFPRTIAQAEALARLLTGRRVCRACGHTYHLTSSPPKRAGVCDTCGGELYQREDDSEATVRKRLEVYQRQTEPLLDYYRQRRLLAPVSGEGPVRTIRDAVRAAARGDR
jgi:adenylate kinase